MDRIIKIVVQGIGLHLKAALDVPNEHRRVTGIEPRIDYLPREARANGLLQVRD